MDENASVTLACNRLSPISSLLPIFCTKTLNWSVRISLINSRGRPLRLYLHSRVIFSPSNNSVGFEGATVITGCCSSTKNRRKKKSLLAYTYPLKLRKCNPSVSSLLTNYKLHWEKCLLLPRSNLPVSRGNKTKSSTAICQTIEYIATRFRRLKLTTAPTVHRQVNCCMHGWIHL